MQQKVIFKDPATKGL